MFAELDTIFSNNTFWKALGVISAVAIFLWKTRNKNGYRKKSDCIEFRGRLGKESMEHKARLDNGDKRFVKIEKSLIFLVEKAEPGAAAKMGLYE